MNSLSEAKTFTGIPPATYPSHMRVEADAFPRTTLGYMVLMTGITLTAYMPYWLYTRTKTLNTIAKSKIGSAVVFGAIVAYALAFLAAVGQAFIPYTDPQRLILLVLAGSANSSLIVWVLMIRKRLSEDVLHRPHGEQINLMMTIMLSIFFMQSKINEAQDAD